MRHFVAGSLEVPSIPTAAGCSEVAFEPARGLLGRDKLSPGQIA